MHDSMEAENARREAESQKFLGLGDAVRIYVAKFGSPAARKSGHVQRLVYEDPKTAVDHIQRGVNLPEDLTYESQFKLAKAFLERMFNEPFDPDALLAEGMPPDTREPLSGETETLLKRYMDLHERLEKILHDHRLIRIPDQSPQILFLGHAIEQSIEDIFDREEIPKNYAIDKLTKLLEQIESELK